MNYKKIFIKTKENARLLSCADIAYCVAQGGYSQIYMRQGDVFLVSKPLKWLTEELDVIYIIRISQSILVNIHYIKQVYYQKRLVEIMNGEMLRYTVTKRDLEMKIQTGLTADSSIVGDF